MSTIQAKSKLSRYSRPLSQRTDNSNIDTGTKDSLLETKFQKLTFPKTTKAKLSARSMGRSLESGTDAQKTETWWNKQTGSTTMKQSVSNLSARSLDGLKVNKKTKTTEESPKEKQTVTNLPKFKLRLEESLNEEESDIFDAESEEKSSRSQAETPSSRSEKESSATKPSGHKTQRSQMAGTDVDPEPAKVFYCWECFDVSLDPSSVGFCVDCNDYLCLNCVNIHGGRVKTMKHTIFAGRDMEQILKTEAYESDSSDSEPEKPEFLKEPKLVRECVIMAPEDKEKCTIHSATAMADGSVVLCDIMNNNLKHFDVKFRLKSVLDLGSGPRDICTSNIKDSEVYVTLNSFHAFFQIATKPKLEIIQSTMVGGECYGITCWKLGIAVTAAVKKFAEGTLELFLFDYQGHTLRRVQQNVYDQYEMYFDDYKGKDDKKRHREIGKMQFDLPWNLSADEKGQRILVSDYGNHTVTCINVDGKVEYRFDDANLNGPASLTTDEEGNIFILGQRSHNVYQLTRNREKLGQILTRDDGLEYPGAILYNSVNKTLMLQVRGWSDKIQVYKLD